MTNPLTGTDVHRAIQEWQRLAENERATWEQAAGLHRSRGERTTATAEFVAARLGVVLRRRREGRRDEWKASH